MSHERLKHMKENLMSCIENQMCNIYEADCEELGEAVDMLKDLEEALYYCTITEAMEGKKQQGYEQEQMYNRSYSPMYARDMNDRGGRGDGNESRNGGNRPRSYDDGMSYRMYDDGMMWARGGSSSGGSNSGSSNGGSSSSYMMMRDPWEGRSPESRRMYMESKHKGQDKSTQLKELEKYMQELSQDMTEMIADSSPEEKQYLEKKISALASKIGQMK